MYQCCTRVEVLLFSLKYQSDFFYVNFNVTLYIADNARYIS